MIITLQFNMPEEQEEHAIYMHAHEYRRVLDAVAQELRRIRKYESHSRAARAMACRIERVLRQEAAEEGIEL